MKNLKILEDKIHQYEGQIVDIFAAIDLNLQMLNMRTEYRNNTQPNLMQPNQFDDGFLNRLGQKLANINANLISRKHKFL